jgi:hypothetical protein
MGSTARQRGRPGRRASPPAVSRATPRRQLSSWKDKSQIISRIERCRRHELNRATTRFRSAKASIERTSAYVGRNHLGSNVSHPSTPICDRHPLLRCRAARPQPVERAELELEKKSSGEKPPIVDFLAVRDIAERTAGFLEPSDVANLRRTGTMLARIDSLSSHLDRIASREVEGLLDHLKTSGLVLKTPKQMALFVCHAVRHTGEATLANPRDLGVPDYARARNIGSILGVALPIVAVLLVVPPTYPCLFGNGPFVVLSCCQFFGVFAGGALQYLWRLNKINSNFKRAEKAVGSVDPFEKPDFSAVTNTRLALQNRLLELRALKQHNDRAHDDLKRIITLDASGPYGAQARALLLLAQ